MAASRQILAVGPGHRFTHPHHHEWWMHYCNTVQEHSPVVCFAGAVEKGLRLSGVERRVQCQTMLLATDGGRWRSASSDDAGKGEWWRRGSGQVQLLARVLVAEEKPRGERAVVAVDERRADDGGYWADASTAGGTAELVICTANCAEVVGRAVTGTVCSLTAAPSEN